MNNTLRMSLKKKWFDMTKARIKREDYREITPYWISRLCTDFSYSHDVDTPLSFQAKFKYFTTNTMTLGYPSNDDTERILILEHKGIEIRTGNPEWGAEPNKIYFVIIHGEIINNMKQTAVDFLAAEQAELFLQFTNKKISLSEYAVNITNAHKQAKGFFREQIEEAYKHAQVLHAVGDETRAEQYYTQTFKQPK